MASSERDDSSERDASGEPEHEPEDAVVLSEQLREAGFSAVNEADIPEWLCIVLLSSYYKMAP